MFQSNKTKRLSVFLLVMLISGSIDSIRNLPATALFGDTIIFFFVLSAIVFLLPAALISAELSASWPTKGGVYNWVGLAFGKKTAFFTIWLQWINTIVWFPTILSFIAGTAAYLLDPALAQNKAYLVAVIVGTFWALTLINLKGVHASAKFVSVCTVTGLIIPMVLIIVCAIVWIVMGDPLQLTFAANALIPKIDHTDSWISLTAIMTAFLGMELATVHVQNVDNPQKTFPKALFFSVIIILATMIMGSLAIAIVIPHAQINLTSGVMEAFTQFLKAFHLSWMLPILTVMILVGSLGGIINWIISPAKGLLQASQHGFLPKFFEKENKHGVASNLLLSQAVLVSLVCLAFLLMPSVNGSYWLLTDLSTQLYMMMYVLMFVAAICLRYKYKDQPRPFKIPGGNFGMWLVGLLGVIGSLVTLAVGFIPPSGINVGGAFHYEVTFVTGILIMLVPVLFFFAYRAYNHKAV